MDTLLVQKSYTIKTLVNTSHFWSILAASIIFKMVRLSNHYFPKQKVPARNLKIHNKKHKYLIEDYSTLHLKTKINIVGDVNKPRGY